MSKYQNMNYDIAKLKTISIIQITWLVTINEVIMFKFSSSMKTIQFIIKNLFDGF